MHLQSLKGCRLAIGSYPTFEYDARGGGGEAKLEPSEKENLLHLSFSSQTFSIPPLTSQTTKFLSLPLPPGLKVEMSMDKLQGSVNKNSGEIILEFEARFIFSIASILYFPDLIVKTSLETSKVKSNLYQEQGHSLKSNGEATLVGVALIPATGNKILDLFLGLPNEALAVLRCKLK